MPEQQILLLYFPLLTYLDCGSTALAPTNGLAARSTFEGVGSWRKAVVVRAQAAAARSRSKGRQVFEVDAGLLLLVVAWPAAAGDDGGAMAPVLDSVKQCVSVLV